MSIIRLTREFSFEMSHTLTGYDGACSEIHGHSYRLFVTVRGVPRAAADDPKQGMVMDFGVLKGIVNELIVSRFDHALLLRDEALAAELGSRFERVVAVSFQPTCENLIAWFATLIRPALPEGVELFSLRLHETANSFAEWFAGDN
jgi:6-pyruvoyltetrahydropterin/6-carboxytetrahydropterin synthase